MPPRKTEDWMWAEACEMLERAERLQRQFFQLGAGGVSGPTWEPPVDVVEAHDEIAILVALPGVEPGRVQVVIDGPWLIVTGVRPVPAAYRTSAIHRLEIPHGRFERRIQLMWGRLELRRRELVNGCLLLTLGKVA